MHYDSTSKMSKLTKLSMLFRNSYVKSSEEIKGMSNNNFQECALGKKKCDRGRSEKDSKVLSSLIILVFSLISVHLSCTFPPSSLCPSAEGAQDANAGRFQKTSPEAFVVHCAFTQDILKSVTLGSIMMSVQVTLTNLTTVSSSGWMQFHFRPAAVKGHFRRTSSTVHEQVANMEVEAQKKKKKKPDTEPISAQNRRDKYTEKLRRKVYFSNKILKRTNPEN